MWRSAAAVLVLRILSLTDALQVSDVFPGGASGTSTASVKCRAGYTVAGGPDDSTKATNYRAIAPCRLFCECVGHDGSCNYCCKYTSPGTCSRHAPVYGFSSVSTCFKCKPHADATAAGATLTLHASGVFGRVGKSTADATKRWIARGTNYYIPVVPGGADANGIKFSYYSGFVACWGLKASNLAPTGYSGEDIACPSSDADYPATEDESSTAEVGTQTDYVPGDEFLSSVLNQGGCGNCYIQSSMATVTDRILKQDDTMRPTMQSNKESYSTGHMTRCHYSAGSGESACDGGSSKHVFTQMTGQTVSAWGHTLPALSGGLAKCTGGKYGGPGVGATDSPGTSAYYSNWAYGCVGGCKPFQAGFDGPPVPAGATCPSGYTDDATKLYNGLLPDAASITEASGSNVNQFSSSCGCPGTIQATGTCSSCCARTASGTTYTIGGVSSPAECTYAQQSWLGAESDWPHFGMTGEDIMGWSGLSLSNKFFALSTCGCPNPSVPAPAVSATCSKCCLPKRGSKPGWQYNPKNKAAQAPDQCSGSGVTAGSTPGAGACTIALCAANTCEDGSSMPSDPVVMDNAAQSVYNPIGVPWKTSKAWNPMNEHFIKDEIAQYGPVTAGFGVPNNFGSFFQATPTGVYVSDANQATHGGHSVAIVGWGVDASNNNQKYWLVRNSWGRDWAANGYFKIEIGGNSAAGSVGFASATQGIAAIAPFFKPSGGRRLVADESSADESRRLLSHDMEETSNDVTVMHGGKADCNAANLQELTTLRTWFLNNASNYNAVSGTAANCPTPWTYEGYGSCKAQVSQGLDIEAMLEVKDCNDATYHWYVKFSWQLHTGDVAHAKVIISDGPTVMVGPSTQTSSQLTSNNNNTVDTASAYVGRSTMAAAMLLLSIASWW